MKPSVQWLRRAVQLAVLAAIVLVPLLAQYRVLLARNQMDALRAQETPSLARTVMLGTDRVLRASPPNAETDAALVETLGRVQGNHWSAKLFGVSWTDPLAAFESLSAARKVTVTLVAGLILPVALTLVFGRVFCSWICPAGLLFDVADGIRSWLPGATQRRDVRFWRGNKYVLLAAGLAVSFVLGAPLLGFFYPPALMGREIGQMVQSFFEGLAGGGGRVGGFVLTGASVFLLGVVLVELSVSRRMWCRYLCPGGALYSLLGRKRAVGLKNELTLCTRCTDCVPACPMGLNPMNNQFGPECDLCLGCRVVCQSRSIRFYSPLRRPARSVKTGGTG